MNLVTKMIKVELRLIVRGKAKRKTILCQSLNGGTTQVLEETNKAGLNALLLAVHTGQPEVGFRDKPVLTVISSLPVNTLDTSS